MKILYNTSSKILVPSLKSFLSRRQTVNCWKLAFTFLERLSSARCIICFCQLMAAAIYLHKASWQFSNFVFKDILKGAITFSSEGWSWYVLGQLCRDQPVYSVLETSLIKLVFTAETANCISNNFIIDDRFLNHTRVWICCWSAQLRQTDFFERTLATILLKWTKLEQLA